MALDIGEERNQNLDQDIGKAVPLEVFAVEVNRNERRLATAPLRHATAASCRSHVAQRLRDLASAGVFKRVADIDVVDSLSTKLDPQALGD